MDYGKIVSRSWNIVWNNKWMFVLGFLAALGGGGGGGGGGRGFNNDFSGRGGDFGSMPSEIERMFERMLPFIIALICFFFILAIVLWLVRLIAEAGMISSVDRLEQGEKMSLGAGFKAGTNYLKQMVGLSLILAAPFIAIGVIVALVTFGVVAAGFSNGGGDAFGAGLGILALCAIPIFCILALIGLVVSFVYPLAQRGVILNGMGVVDSIRHGWGVLKENLSEVIVLAIIFGLLGVAVGFVILIVGIPLMLAFVLPAILAASSNSAALGVGAVLLGIVGVILFIFVAAAISSVVRTVQSTAFTLAYQEWTGTGMEKELAVAE